MENEKDSVDENLNLSSTNRRDFLRSSATVVVGASLIGVAASDTKSLAHDADTSNQPKDNKAKNNQSQKKSAGETNATSIPPHDPIHLPGVHGYAQRSLVAGETLRVRMSADSPYQLTIRRLGKQIDERESDHVLATIDVVEPRVQPIHPGSYIHVDQGFPTDKNLKTFSIECWLRPWSLDQRQGIVTQLDDKEPGGIGLVLTEKGKLNFYCGINSKTHEACILSTPFSKRHKWRHLVASWDGHTAKLFINGQKVAAAEFDAMVMPSKSPLRIGASGVEGRASEFLDGDIAAPAIYSVALSESTIAAQFKAAALSPPNSSGLVAFWPLDEERGAAVRDAAHGKHTGRIINRGTWMIGGPAFDAAAVGQYEDYDPAADKKRGHGLRLAADDLYDCRWEVDHEFKIPVDSPSGIYIAEAEFDRKEKPFRYSMTFVVRRAPSQPRADTLVLCATNTWAAYSSTSFAMNTSTPQMWTTRGIKNSHDQAPAYSCYRNHSAGQPTYQVGLNMPWPAAGRDTLYSSPQVGYAHLMRADRYLHAWLESEGHKFDVASDLDLHKDPTLLKGRKVVIINGHSEYWTRESYKAIDTFLTNGGSALVLSGNTMFWRVSFDEEVMECRKFGDNIGSRGNSKVGELYHTHDHHRGALMRECGLPAWRVVGLETAGFNNNADISTYAPYTVTDADHSLFTTPHQTHLKKGDTFGSSANETGPRAIGHEWDVRVSQLVKMTGEVPPGVTLPEDPAGIQTLAQGILHKPGKALDYLTRDAELVDGVAAELIDWKRPTGGRVINFGAIGVGWALEVDPILQTVMRNALHACRQVS